MATPHEFVQRLEHAVRAPRGRRGSVLILTVPKITLPDRSFSGRFLGEERIDQPDGSVIVVPNYGYTRRQCRKMKGLVEAAIGANATYAVRQAVESEDADFYTGDHG